MTGEVSAFDDHAGLGVVVAEDGTEYSFHCTQIADGSRTIEIGIAVEFDIEPGPLGRWEAAVVRPRVDHRRG